MSDNPPVVVGFIGLGSMGEPMALNLVRAGTPLVVWNRTLGKTAALELAGAKVAASVSEVFALTDIIILMLSDSEAIDCVLGRRTPGFGRLVKDRTVVHMGTTSSGYSRSIASDIGIAGGRYVEAPVSGSRSPAELGQLVVMLAGDEDIVNGVRPLLAPICSATIACGPVPNALSMKLASNLFLISMLTGLAEAVNYARKQGLDMEQFVSILGAGPLSSDLLRSKMPKLVTRDFDVQASIENVLESHRLISEAAQDAGIAVPLLDTCHALYRETAKMGFAKEDAVAVLRAIEERSKTESR